MSYQILQTLSQITIAAGLMLTALGGYGAFHYGKKIEEEKEKKLVERPFIVLCKRGIQVEQLNDTTAYFDIPYCAGKNANAYNVELQTAIIIKLENNELKIIAPFQEKFPKNITLSYETGQSINYKLSPFSIEWISKIYIYVKGSFTDRDKTHTYPVLDIYKFNSYTNDWVKLLDEEDKSVRLFLVDENIL